MTVRNGAGGMRILRVVGPSDSGKTTLIERLTEHLAQEGQVATIKHIDCEPTLDTAGKDTARHRAAGAAETYGVAADGSWFATGETRSVEDVLDSLAPATDYCLVEGYHEADLPTVALGGGDHGGETLQRAPDADGVDLDALLSALDDCAPYETLESLVAGVSDSPAAEFAGAIATFTGRVRARDDASDPATELLEFEAYEGVADQRLCEIADDLTGRDGVHEVRMHHRTGVVEAGEDIVFVVVLAGHRAEAFAAVEDGIDRLKAEVPLFKKEITVDGEFWAHQHEH